MCWSFRLLILFFFLSAVQQYIIIYIISLERNYFIRLMELSFKRNNKNPRTIIFVIFSRRHCNTPVTYSRNTPTEESRINSGIVRNYPYWSVALRIVTVINRSSPCISVAILDKFWTCTKICYGKFNRSVSLLVRIKPNWYVLVRTKTVLVRTDS
jgi:hypothetical protein